MKFERLREVAELIGIAAIVISLVFVGLELRQSRELAISDSYRSSVDSYTEYIRFRAEHPDIWLRGNAGDELHASELVIYDALLRSYFNRVFWNTRAQRELGFHADVAAHDFAAFLHRNPGALARWEDWQSRLDRDRQLLVDDRSGRPGIVDLVREDLVKLNSLTEK